MAKRLVLRIRQLSDGRFYVRYHWSIFEHTHREYCKDLDALGNFIGELVANTKWEK